MSTDKKKTKSFIIVIAIYFPYEIFIDQDIINNSNIININVEIDV